MTSLRINCRLWTFWKIAVRKEEKIQVSLSNWLSIKRSEKGDRVQFVLQHHKTDITAWTQYKCLVGPGLQAWERIRAWDARQSRRWLLSPNRVTHAYHFMCLSLHSQTSKSIIFKQKPFIYKVFLWCDGSLKFILSEKKNIRKNPCIFKVVMQWRFWVSSLVAIYFSKFLNFKAIIHLF